MEIIKNIISGITTTVMVVGIIVIQLILASLPIVIAILILIKIFS